MQVRFWGTRGSVPKPGPATVRYGGNTSCVEVRADDGTLIVLDCGTGAHGLGQSLLARGGKIRGHLLIGHTHWDHIQGFPFFGPLFVPGHEWDIYAPTGFGQQLERTLAGQMQYTYFPVQLGQLAATIRYHDLVEGVFQIGGIRVETRYLNHPALTLGYRLEADGASLVYATDHEPHAPQQAGGLGAEAVARGDLPVHREDRRHVEFLAGADLVIHDAQYTAQEYPTKQGWGHSTVEYVVDLAMAAKVRRLALFHHDPLRTDEAVDGLVALCEARVAASEQKLDVFGAAEGATVELHGEASQAEASATPPEHRPGMNVEPARKGELTLTKAILLGTRDPKDTALFHEALGVEVLGADGFRLVQPQAGGDLLAELRELRPALLLLDGARPDLLPLLQALRSAPERALVELPVVVITSEAGQEVPFFAAGVTDVLSKPFSVAYIRSRVRAWLLRTRARWSKPPNPSNEDARLQALRRTKLLDTPQDERLDRIVRLAARMFDVPVVGIGLMDAERQWYKARVGLQAREVPRDLSFCAYTILGQDSFVIADTQLDDRVADMPPQPGMPLVRFYAGHPLRDHVGHALGTLCLMDVRPRQLDEGELQALHDLAQLAEQALREAGQ
jgi:phosphoribosyl 1,2-cyclic phosphodiesterase/CheY-like chemotaxis protein